MPTLLLSADTRDEFHDELQAAAGGALRFAISDPRVRLPSELLRQVDIACMSLDVIGMSTKTELAPEMRVFCEYLRAAPALRWLHAPVAGYDRPIFQEMLARGVTVSTSSGANAEAVAHSALAGFMLLARNGLHWLHAQQQHRWAALRAADAPRDLAGQTAIVIGQGPVGRSIARLLECLELRVFRLRHKPVAGDAAQNIYGYRDLGTLAPQADWIVLACPLSDDTRNLLDANVLNAMPRGSFVVNVGRGGVLDEDALLAALHSGQIAGAHMDVFAAEPLPADSPFWDLPNVLVSPHNAGSSRGFRERGVRIFIDNLARWRRGEALVNEVPPVVTRAAAPY